MNIKSIVACASALVLGLCGCDKGGATASLATSPCAVDGALVSTGFAKAAADKVLGEKKAEFYDNLKKNLPSDFKDALSKAGLDDIEVAWGGLSLVDIEFDESGAPKDGVPEIVVALSFSHDADKLFGVLKEEAARHNSPKTKDAAFSGEKGLVLFDDDMTLALASVSGNILVAGTSEAAAQKGVALYRDGKGGKAIAMNSSSLLKVAANAIGERVIKKLPADLYKGALSPSVEDATALLQGLKDLDASISATDDNGAAISIRLDTASGDDASRLAAYVNEQVAPIKMMMTMGAAQDPQAKPMVDALNALSVAADGAALSVKLTLPGATFKQVAEQAID